MSLGISGRAPGAPGQWKRGRTRFRELRKRQVSQDLAAQTAGSPHRPWRIAPSPALAIALPNAYFAEARACPHGRRVSSLIGRTAGCGPARRVGWQGRRGDPSPYADFSQRLEREPG
jgi:hypothetical protein